MSPPVFPSLDGRGKGRVALEANNPLLISPSRGGERRRESPPQEEGGGGGQVDL